jgi:hypothetical protein
MCCARISLKMRFALYPHKTLGGAVACTTKAAKSLIAVGAAAPT